MTELRWTRIDGPPLAIARAGKDAEVEFERGPPLWSLVVGASYFDRDNAADYAHPLRTLMVDANQTTVNVDGKSPFFQTGKKEHALRAPRLVDIHLIAGAGKLPYRPRNAAERLEINIAAEKGAPPAVLANTKPEKPLFATIGGTHAGPANDAQEGFVHVVGEPQLVDGKQEGDFIDQAGATGKDSQNAIRVPRMRLLQGAIRLIVDAPSAWLGNLDPSKTLPGSPKQFELVLTPSGIEIVTAAEFPGSAGKLKGAFLIAPRDPRETARDRRASDTSNFRLSALTLTLLPRETSQLDPDGAALAQQWSEAFRVAAAPTLPFDDKLRCGIDIRALPSDLPPAFRWPIHTRKGKAELTVATAAAGKDPPLAVDTPADRLRIELRGSRGPDGTHEGAATLMTTRLRIATPIAAQALADELQRQQCLDEAVVPGKSAGTVIVAEARPERPAGGAPAPGAPQYWTVSTIEKTDSVTMALRITKNTGTIPLAHDEHRLAAALRKAVGWEEPGLQKQDTREAPGQNSFSQAHRPIISGFVPLDRGWLQLPLPNLPPPDLGKDTSLLGALDPTPRSVLDGFIRIAERPAVSFVSGYQTTAGAAVGATAPWSVTVEGAGVAVVMAAIEAGTLKQTRAVLREPDLAARGLIWFSADRPDELEALPRLGAGPGSFLDLDLTTTPAPDPAIRVVTVSLAAFELNFDKDGQVGRKALNLSLAFNPSAVDWRKGLAGMRMGQSALASARSVLIDEAVTPPDPANLAKLRDALAKAQATLKAAEADLAKAEKRRVELASAIAEATSKQAAFGARLKTLTARKAQVQIDFDRAHADRDQDRELATSAELFAVTRELDELAKNSAANSANLAALKAEKAQLDGSANVREEIVRTARKNEEKARVALADAEGAAGTFKHPLPWPAVAWLRHPKLPVAAGMPMTRSAASAVRPLESRELAPFAASTVIEARAIKLAALTWDGEQAFPDLAASPAFNRLATGWPRPTAPAGADIVIGPSDGVPFAAFGVPGTEVIPRATPARQWDAPEFAVRYDLPALDETFATAGLPPVAEAAPQEDEREKAADRPTATALDWTSMKDFWDDQERRRHLSLVLDSYLDDFYPSDESPALAVRTLIRGATWTVKTTFDANHVENGLPYGAVAFGGLSGPVFTANVALKGLSGKVSLDAGNVIAINAPAPAPSDPVFDMLGWSPSSFDRAGFRVDNQGFAIAEPVRQGGVITRRYRGSLGAAAKMFASAEQAVTIQGPVQFGFWFKDIPLMADGTFSRTMDSLKTAVDFAAWLDPEEGFEWRLHRVETTPLPAGQQSAFDQGRDRFAFFGLAIEPLRLTKLVLPVDAGGQITSNVPQQADILARVFFADAIEQPIVGGNLVVMTFKTGGGALHLDSIAVAGKPEQLVFAFAAHDLSTRSTAARSRQVLLKAVPAWNGTQLTLTAASVSLALHGRDVTLNGPAITCTDATGKVEITWTPPGTAAPIEPGQARLQVTNLSITSAVDRAGRFKEPELSLARMVEICSARALTGFPELTAQIAAGQKFNILKSSFDLKGETREDDHAIVLTWTNDTAIHPLGVLPGLETGDVAAGGVAVMLAARVDAPSAASTSWILPLGCGRCEGEIRSSQAGASNAVHAQRIRWEIDGRRPDRDDAPTTAVAWDGFVAISGGLALTSAIRWPRLDTTAGASPGRRRVAPRDASGSLAHCATYVLDDHHIPLDACRKLGGDWTFGRPWTAFAAVKHELIDDTSGTASVTILSWTGQESIALGRALDLIPRLPDKTIEPVTFAPRYRSPFKGAPFGTTMIQPGLGALQTVLQGTLGAAFREGYWGSKKGTGIVAAGGFLGLQASDRRISRAEAPLLRLPFLAGLEGDAGSTLAGGSFAQSEFPSDGIELAWADSASARALLVRDRHAVAPASAREDDLIASVRAGALVENDFGPPQGGIVAALTVEQTFRANPPAGTAPLDWKKVPYWIGSAVTVSRVLDEQARTSSRDFRPLSLVAGSVQRDKRARGTAALLQGLPASLLNQPPSVTAAVLISGGNALALEDWTGGDPLSAENSDINGYAAGLAAARHARPLFAVVRAIDKDGAAHYLAVTLPRPVAADLPAMRHGSRAQTRFAEGARGYPISPGPHARRWLSPVLEGPIAAVRDESVSGLAGLGRSLALPAQAGTEVGALDTDGAGEQLARSLIWFTEKRIPVYVPLDIKDMEAPPIPWLQTAPPRVRLPDDADVALVLQGSGLGDRARSPQRLAAQSFLPSAADALTVSERAGVVTARRTFLMGAVPDTTAFDAEQSRFGRAGQAGSSARRWMRTPRPAKLPDNTGDADRDRQPEASPLLPFAPLRFLVGPADTVRGETDKAPTVGALVPWSATMVAAPFSDGVVTDRWDGTVRLAVELDVAAPPGNTAPPGDAPALLAQLLFPFSGDKTKAQALASLKVGELLVRLRWVTILAPGAWVARNQNGMPAQVGERIVWRTRVDLVLDPREQQPAVGAGTAAIHAGLAAALSAGSFAVELRLTVHPSKGDAAAIATGAPVALTLTDKLALAVGTDRPPVTMRWTMPAVTAIRGGMPLLPTTLLFVDPAYEAGLANPPHEKIALLDTKGVTNLPANRGAARVIFSADRGRVNRRGSVAFMLDARFERPSEALADAGDGDFTKASPPLLLLLKLIPRERTETIRFLTVAGLPEPEVRFASVYELSLAALTETDGSPARLQAGDVLELTVTEREPEQVTLTMHNSETGGDSSPIKLSTKPPANAPKPPEGQASRGFGLSLPLTLTDEPVVEPPTALYAALTLTSREFKPDPADASTTVTAPVLSLPLYAQSPLPWRVDFRDLKRDFRAGLVRRSATFVWGLSRSLAEIGTGTSSTKIQAHVVKMDRNGQTYLPETPQELLPPERA
jgi:hypothetical protein